MGANSSYHKRRLRKKEKKKSPLLSHFMNQILFLRSKNRFCFCHTVGGVRFYPPKRHALIPHFRFDRESCQNLPNKTLGWSISLPTRSNFPIILFVIFPSHFLIFFASWFWECVFVEMTDDDDDAVRREFQEGGRDFNQPPPSTSSATSSSSILQSLPSHVVCFQFYQFLPPLY